MEKNRRKFLRNSLLFGLGGYLGIKPKSILAAEKHKSKPLNSTLKTIHQLRTIHGNFTDQAIPEDHLKQILNASVRAANSSNMQTYSIVVVKDQDKMKALCGYQANVLLLFCVDYNRSHASAKDLNYSYYSDNITAFITGSTNTILAAQTATIAAKSLGIDSLLTNGIHRGDMSRIWEIMDLPKTNCYPLIALLLGYPTEEPEYQKGRLTDLGIIHQEKYQSITGEDLDKINEIYDNPENHLSLNPDWKKNGHKHYQDWLFGTWLGRRLKPTTEPTQMLTLLKRSGFFEG